MEPAASILDRIGIENVAQITGKHVSRVHRWAYPKTRGGTGGVIPHAEALKLLAYARDNAVALTAEDFLREPTAAGPKEGIAPCPRS